MKKLLQSGIEPSKKYSLNWIDAGKGLLVAAGTSAAYFIQGSLDSGSMQFHWKACAMVAISGAVAYLAKNFLSQPPK